MQRLYDNKFTKQIVKILDLKSSIKSIKQVTHNAEKQGIKNIDIEDRKPTETKQLIIGLHEAKLAELTMKTNEITLGRKETSMREGHEKLNAC